MYYMKCYMQTAILKPNQRQEAGEVNGQAPKPSETKSQMPKAKWSVKPRVQSQKQEARSQKPEAKSQVGMQMGDSSSKMHANHTF